MANTVEVKGLKELDAVLKSLPEKIEQNVMRGAIRAGQNVMLNAVREKLRSNGSIQSGLLADSLRISFSRKALKRGWLNAKVIAGRRSKASAKSKTGDAAEKKKEPFYAYLLEFGTAAHFISIKEDAKPNKQTRRGERKYSYRTINNMVKRGSLVIGKHFVGQSVAHPGARPKPFMRPAFDESQQAAIEAFAEYVRKRLPKELKKAGRV